MGSLYEYLSAVPDYRSRRGQRFGDGSRDIGATVRFVERDRHSGLLQEVEATAIGGGALMDERQRKPGCPELFRVLSNVGPEVLDEALQGWSAQYQDPGGGWEARSVTVGGRTPSEPSSMKPVAVG